MAKGLGDGGLDTIRALVADSALRVLGLVVDKVDKIMHGMEMGVAGMHKPRRDVARHGLDEEIVMLKTSTSRPA